MTLQFGGEFQESVDEVGKILFDCACRSGFGNTTYLHAVGDGAPWINGQVEKRFGEQGHYLIDFYHMCEYLGDAASSCAEKDETKSWIERQKKFLQEGHTEKVIEALQPYIEADETEDKKAPVRCCLRYLRNRPGQFDYPGARSRGLPVGSGEVESAHRYVIQERLKLAGAWWKPENARTMIALRVVRANRDWDKYWDQMSKAA